MRSSGCDMGKVFYVLREVAYHAISIPSRVLNTLCGGSMNQTFSARVYVEAHRKGGKWESRRKAVDTLFFWQDAHTRDAWEAQVTRARKTLTYSDLLTPASAKSPGTGASDQDREWSTGKTEGV